MYKMIIVDDEPATRQGIKTAVNWSMLGIEIVGEASNGIEGLELINRVNPDIIICDIRMPKMDGISLINEIQPSRRNMQVLFLSGYSDKEYLKKAIKLDVVDYIYKPFDLSELIAAVEKAKQNCAKTATAVSGIPNDIALELLEYGKPGSSISIPEKDLAVDVNAPMISILVRINLSKNNFQLHNELNSDAFDSKVLVRQYFNSFQKAFSEIYDNKFIISYVNNGYVVHANVSKTYLYDDVTLKKLNQLFSLITDVPDCLSIGVSEVTDSVSGLKEAYSQARAAAVSAFFLGYGKVLLYRNLSTKVFEPSKDLNSLFYDEISSNNVASAINFLDDYIETMQSCRWQDICKIKDELASIAFWLIKKTKSDAQISQSYITEILNSTLDILDIKQYLMQLLEQILEDINNLDNKGRIIFEVERFIIDHLSKDVSIKTIAESVYITPTYLCCLYKKNTGRTINQFIQDIKMKKAKKLIIETNLRLGEIAQQLGFSNQNYFTKTFTGYYGVNPSTFRNKSL